MINSSVLSSEENDPIGCNNESAKRIKIEIINYDDEPIEISDIKAFSEQCRLVANLPQYDNTYLVYGKKEDHAPTYDLAHFKEKIPVALTEAAYGQAEVQQKELAQKPAPENKKWIWIAMGAVIILIGFFALSMVKKEQN